VVLQKSGSNFRSLGVEQNCASFVRSLLESLSQIIERFAMGLMITVGEVKSCHIHSGVEHLDEHVNIPASRSTNSNEHQVKLLTQVYR